MRNQAEGTDEEEEPRGEANTWKVTVRQNREAREKKKRKAK